MRLSSSFVSGGWQVKDNVYTICYAGVLGTVCALLLTAAASFTAPYQEANADAQRNRNILNVLQVPYPAEASSQQLVKIFEDSVRLEQSGELEIYRYVPPKDSDNDETVAFGFEGPGLWGHVKGFLALDPDMKEIRGITFYEQEETPGLGGEIVTEGFRKRFVGKMVHDKDDNVGIVICKPGSAKEQNEIDGITGATMTCDKVQAMINETIKSIVEDKQ
jgi:Na+-transporting NADH:ubiquinone oxidoreductase subunit C